MIHIDAMRYRYPGAATDAVDDVTLHIGDGESVVVAGPSGSGKSTLVRAIAGLVPHMHGGTLGGSVSIDGRNTREAPPRLMAGTVGFVDQDSRAQAVAERVEDDIAFAMENLGVAPAKMRARMEEVLDALDLAALRDRRLDTLSGGERQRAAIAAVLVTHPRVLVLDEPTSQLDPGSAEEVLAVVQRLNADFGLTVVLVEHRLERVVQYADRLIVMNEGRIIADGDPGAVLAEGQVETPLSRLARGLSWEQVPLTVRDGRRAVNGWRPPAPAPVQSSTGAPLVIAEGLRVARGGTEVVKGVDLLVRSGETVAVVGRNGAGKTTVLRTLIGALRPHGGRRSIAGLDPNDTLIEQIARNAAYLPQSADAILFQPTVRAEIAFTLRARGAIADIEQVLEAEGLQDIADEDPRDLSVGQRLRVAFAAVTVGGPQVWLLDEPTRGLDTAGKDGLVQRCRAHAAAGGATILVTHDVELVARLATRVVVMADGDVIVDGPVRDVLGGSTLFSTQVHKVFDAPGVLTVEDALAGVGA